MHIERFYTSVYDQCSSLCGKYLACCSNFGRISIFNLQEATTSTKEVKKHHFTFKIGSTAYCLVTCGDLLICGIETGEVRMYAWESLINKNSTTKHLLPSPSNDHSKGVTSTCMDGDILYYSQGSLVHRCDVNDGFKHLTALQGHTDYIHSIQACKQQLHSASEDGSVISWDTRSNRKSHALVPSNHRDCDIKEVGALSGVVGKWVKSIAVCEDKDYMVCGGGFKMGLWYPGYKEPTTVFNFNHNNNNNNNKKNNTNNDNNINDNINGFGDNTNKMEVDDNGGDVVSKNSDVKSGSEGVGVSKGITNHIILNNGTIMSCGDSGNVTTWATNGDVLSTLPCSSFNLYNIHVNQLAPRLLTVAGSSNSIDACINFNYKSFHLHMA